MKRIVLFFLCFLLLFSSCRVKKKHTKKEKHIKVHVYHGGTPNNTATTDDDYLWYYVIYLNSNSFYYTTSPIPLTSYDNVDWKTARENPVNGLVDLIQSTLLDIDLASFSTEVQSSIPADQVTEVEVTDNSSGDSQGDSEGDSSGDSSGDSGGSDGGGDSGGGGDGGDGGE